MRVAIIGGGISGLAVAYYLQKLGISYDLFEGSAEVGGTIRTVNINGYLLECGPNSLQMTDELNELISELKLEAEVHPTLTATNNRYVLHGGSYQKLPTCPYSLLSNSFLSGATKRRILEERKIPSAFIPYETVTRFFERRFGSEATDSIINPYITNLLSGDPDQLLIEKALPEFKELEIKFGSVLRGLSKRRNGSGNKSFTFRGGMSTLPQAIADKLISLHTERKIEVITRCMGKYILCSATPHEMEDKEYDAVVLALPAHKAADLMDFTFPGISAALQNVNYPPLAVVHSIYNRQDVEHPLDGFGAIHPKTEVPFSNGSVWVSSLFNGRCKPYEVLLTSYVGGTPYEAHAKLPEKELLQRVHEENQTNYAISSAPVFQHVTYWKKSMPQYDLYIEDAHEMARMFEEANIFVAANWQGGVLVSDCIRHAKELASKINLKAPLAQSA